MRSIIKTGFFMTRLNFKSLKYQLFHRTIAGTQVDKELIWPIQHNEIACQTQLVGSDCYVQEIVSVGHIDTLDNQRRNIPKDVVKKTRTVLFLENEHFLDNSEMLIKLQNNLIKPLVDKNCRVIVPFGLGSKHTKPVYGVDRRIFVHQIFFERLDFLLKFLINKNVQKIDLVIGHSLANFMALGVKTSLKDVGSVAIINPIPGNGAPKWIKPGKLSLMFTDMFNKALAFPLVFLWICLRRLLLGKELMGWQFSNHEIKHFLSVSHGIQYEMVRGMAFTMDSFDTPFLYISCRDDPVVNKKDEEEYLKLLQVGDLHEYDDELKACNLQGSVPRRMHGIRIPGSSHFPFHDKNSSEIIVRELLKLLDRETVEKDVQP